jgi:hypothetical protein
LLTKDAYTKARDERLDATPHAPATAPPIVIVIHTTHSVSQSISLFPRLPCGFEDEPSGVASGEREAGAASSARRGSAPGCSP